MPRKKRTRAKAKKARGRIRPAFKKNGLRAGKKNAKAAVAEKALDPAGIHHGDTAGGPNGPKVRPCREARRTEEHTRSDGPAAPTTEIQSSGLSEKGAKPRLPAGRDSSPCPAPGGQAPCFTRLRRGSVVREAAASRPPETPPVQAPEEVHRPGPLASGSAGARLKPGPALSKVKVVPDWMLAPSFRVLVFEAEAVDSEMRVASSALCRLYGMVRTGEIDARLSPICRTPKELLAEWTGLPRKGQVAVLVNLAGAGRLTQALAAKIFAGAEGAYWIVFETLRSELRCSGSAFLSAQRSGGMARVIGYGPRNIVPAARQGAEAVRGYVLWGFGGRKVSSTGTGS